MRVLHAVAAASLVGIVLAGCTAAPDPDPTAAPHPAPTVTPGAVTDAINLVGLWRVSEAEGETPDTWLRLDAGEAKLWRECGISSYAWGARDGAFISIPSSWRGCEQLEPGSPPWLEVTTSYEKDGEGWTLLDDEGTVTARLAEDGAPVTPADIPDEFTPPTIEPRTELHFQQPMPLPTSLTQGDITGRWLTEDRPENPRIYVEFTPGTWVTSDGCNGQQGRWTTTGTGLLVAGSGMTTLMGCENIPVADWVLRAISAGFDGDTLVLVGAAGSELGRLVRE